MKHAFCQASVVRRGWEYDKLIRVAITIFSEPASYFRRFRGQDPSPDFWAYSTTIEHLICRMIEKDVRL